MGKGKKKLSKLEVQISKEQLVDSGNEINIEEKRILATSMSKFLCKGECSEVIEEVTKMPIIRPLITMNKDDIIRKAREINTFDDSIEEYKDCCSIVSREGKTKTKLKDVSYTEDKIDLDKMIKETLENTTTLDIRK